MKKIVDILSVPLEIIVSAIATVIFVPSLFALIVMVVNNFLKYVSMG